MTIPTVTTLNTHGKHYAPKGDGRDDTFVEMLTVKNDRHDGYSPPLVSADYWAVMPQVEARLEAARAARAEQERAENYRKAVDALGRARSVKEERELGYELDPLEKMAKRMRTVKKQDWERIEPALVELREQGHTYDEIGRQLGVDPVTLRKHLTLMKKKGVA